MNDEEKTEYDLRESDLENIMDKAADYFRRDPIRFGDRTSLCKSYVQAILMFTRANGLVIIDGTFRKKSNETK